MTRIARKDLKTPFLHVMIQGINKEYIFYDNEHIEKYLEIFNDNKQNYNISIIAYCMMNNHAHFLIYTEKIEELGKFIQKVNLKYLQFYNKEKNRSGVLFRNRYKSEPIYNKEYLINCIKYIHNNPVKANIVKSCEEYQYSSYNNYMMNKGECKSEIMQELFGKNCNFKELFKKAYCKRFMDDEVNEECVEDFIKDGIKEFAEKNKIEYYCIFSNRDILKKLISFLKMECKIKYKEMENFFEMSINVINYLK